jgi:hypothetical protein
MVQEYDCEMDFGGKFLYTSWPVKGGARGITTIELTTNSEIYLKNRVVWKQNVSILRNKFHGIEPTCDHL